MFQNPKKRAARRSLPIHAYTGPNGSGKSLAAVWDTLPTLEAGRPVLSTVRLLDYQNPRPCEGCESCAGTGLNHMQAHPLWIPFTSWEQLLAAEKCDVLMDEVTGVASSRESMSMPAPVANTLVQLRRRDVAVRWTAPNWARADKIIRECSQAVTYCKGFLPVAAHDEDGQRMWRNRRFFKWSTYDAADFEEFTSGKREQLGTTTVDFHWGPKSPAFAAYDTLDAVLAIGSVSDSGRCYTCDGARRAPECSCPDYVHRKLDARDAAAEAARARPEAEHAAPPRTPGTRPGSRRRLDVIGS